MTKGYEMMINDNKEDVKQESYRLFKLINDKNALVMMCGRNEELLKNRYDLHMLQGYEHTLLIIRNEHQRD
jgi:hypothetical protein